MKRWLLLIVFFGLTVLFPGAFLAADLIQSNEVTITAVVPENGSSSSSSASTSSISGSSGGVAGGANSGSLAEDGRASIHIEGYSFPNAKIQLVVNGLPSDSWFAEEDGFFSRNFRTEEEGVLILSLSARLGGYSSATSTFTLLVEADQILDLSTVLLSPVLDSTDGIAWTGLSIPGSEVTVLVNGVEAQTLSASEVDGSFDFLVEGSLDGTLYLTCAWEGQSCGTSLIHILTSSSDVSDEASVETVESLLTPESQVSVGEDDLSSSSALLSDLNSDGKVNYVDFGVLREVYLEGGYAPLVDLDSDGALNLLDFSLLAYQWTIP